MPAGVRPPARRGADEGGAGAAPPRGTRRLSADVGRLHAHARLGNTAEVAALLAKDKGVNPDAVQEGVTAVWLAAQAGRAETALELLKHGANPDARRAKDDVPALYIAAQGGHEEALAALLQHGAAVDAAKGNGATALYIASQQGHAGIVRLLLEHGASVAARTEQGISALTIASFMGEPEVAALLLRYGADPNSRDGGKTAMEWARGKALEAESQRTVVVRPQGRPARDLTARELRDAFSKHGEIARMPHQLPAPFAAVSIRFADTDPVADARALSVREVGGVKVDVQPHAKDRGKAKDTRDPAQYRRVMAAIHNHARVSRMALADFRALWARWRAQAENAAARRSSQQQQLGSTMSAEEPAEREETAEVIYQRLGGEGGSRLRAVGRPLSLDHRHAVDRRTQVRFEASVRAAQLSEQSDYRPPEDTLPSAAAAALTPIPDEPVQAAGGAQGAAQAEAALGADAQAAAGAADAAAQPEAAEAPGAAETRSEGGAAGEPPGDGEPPADGEAVAVIKAAAEAVANAAAAALGDGSSSATGTAGGSQAQVSGGAGPQLFTLDAAPSLTPTEGPGDDVVVLPCALDPSESAFASTLWSLPPEAKDQKGGYVPFSKREIPATHHFLQRLERAYEAEFGRTPGEPVAAFAAPTAQRQDTEEERRRRRSLRRVEGAFRVLFSHRAERDKAMAAYCENHSQLTGRMRSAANASGRPAPGQQRAPLVSSHSLRAPGKNPSGYFSIPGDGRLDGRHEPSKRRDTWARCMTKQKHLERRALRAATTAAVSARIEREVLGGTIHAPEVFDHLHVPGGIGPPGAAALHRDRAVCGDWWHTLTSEAYVQFHREQFAAAAREDPPPQAG
eukprot:TRINITY_DN15044_c0_g2_i1.p1 TRINITY_DN15044_c0_g2~~TRINITY_DN15044_c0_g2_i1.p1  ORF type:complete len:881 (+),score=245.97 TRINITY_DN15044_c0_g2_i1:81-2645(+)